ncbi:HEAT repeat domain-containing protein [Nitrospira moscoviensis]|uniref:HEAT repeat domain-containing protein n=1 Tax=Nitrospira moscoviensis TaxID=42253 RepID=UPI0006A786E8|nr:HEAT repeat domain-containing protein [Nitrospira moscoviensis]
MLDWMAQALASPDVQVRLNALETWAREGERSAVDPLMLALNDPDTRVRERAMQLIEQDWLAEQALLSNAAR